VRRIALKLCDHAEIAERRPARTLVTDVCGLSWDLVTGLTETILKPLFLVSLRRSLFLVEGLPDRVALALWEYAGHPEARRARGLLPATLTHEQIAAVVGASRPRVSLALKTLERHGLFHRDGRRIRVQEQRLRRYLERKYEFLL
jgi:CRP-like cAMP-binding protein